MLSPFNFLLPITVPFPSGSSWHDGDTGHLNSITDSEHCRDNTLQVLQEDSLMLHKSPPLHLLQFVFLCPPKPTRGLPSYIQTCLIMSLAFPHDHLQDHSPVPTPVSVFVQTQPVLEWHSGHWHQYLTPSSAPSVAQFSLKEPSFQKI